MGGSPVDGASDAGLVAVCLVVRNEQAFIRRSIESVRDLADEIWVADTGSTDGTARLAEALGARVIRVPWREDFAQARNAVVERVRSRWIMMLDGDEWLDVDQARSLRQDIARWDGQPDIQAFAVFQDNLASTALPVVRDRTRVTRGFRNRPQHRYQFAVEEEVTGLMAAGTRASPYRLVHAGYTTEEVAHKRRIARTLGIVNRLLALDQPRERRVRLLIRRSFELRRDGRRDEALADATHALDSIVACPAAGRSLLPLAFASAASIRLEQGDYEGIWRHIERTRPLAEAGQLIFPLFEGLARFAAKDLEASFRSLRQAIDLFEQAAPDQTYLNYDEVALGYAALASASAAMGQGEQALAVLGRAMTTLGERQPVANALVKLAHLFAPDDLRRVLEDAPTSVLVAAARAALSAGNAPLCLVASEAARMRGDPGALPWVGAYALQQGRPDLALDVLGAVPANHPCHALARRLAAMAHWLLGRREAFESYVETEEPIYRAALRRWAGLTVSGSEWLLADQGTQALAAMVPLPAARPLR
jgi:tetratricopeptide (TPR) repeat protein